MRNAGSAVLLGVWMGWVVLAVPAWAQFSVEMPLSSQPPQLPINPPSQSQPSSVASLSPASGENARPSSTNLQPISSPSKSMKKPEKHPRWGLIGGGIALTTLGYLGAVVPAAVAEQRCKTGEWNTDLYAPCLNPLPSVEPLYVPVAGPFMRMSSSNNSIEKLLYGLNAAAQLGGLAMVIIGAAWWKAETPSDGNATQRVTFRFLPTLSGSEAKLALVGTF